MLRVLWLVPARSGSKSIPHKNIKRLNGIPLLAYRIKTALSIAERSDVWCSTDSEEYAEVAKKAGADVPFIRPPELSGDLASSNDVVMHAMEHAEYLGRKYDMVGLLEPTSPFVYYEDVLNAVEQLRNDKDAEAIVAVKEARPNSLFVQDDSTYLDTVAARMAELRTQARQSLKKQITPSGGFYISKWDSFKKNKTFYTGKTLAYQVPSESELEIDEPVDWMWAEFLLNNDLVRLNKLFK